jgi:hypothetical protein
VQIKRRLLGDAALAPLVANHRSLLRRRWHSEKLDGGTRSLPLPGRRRCARLTLAVGGEGVPVKYITLIFSSSPVSVTSSHNS